MKTAALCPATTWKQKHWTEKGWAELADRLAQEHKTLPVFLGSKADLEMIGRIRAQMVTDPVSAAGMTTIKQAAALLQRSSFAISVDTGLLHAANALGVRTVGLFGPTTWDYLGRKDSLHVVAKNLSCMPCFRSPSCDHYDCMDGITADEVISAALDWLAE